MIVVNSILNFIKKNIISLILLIICFFVIILLLNAGLYYDYVLNNTIGSKISNRKIIIDNINQINEINFDYDDLYPHSFIIANYNDNNYYVDYLIDEEYNILEGNDLINNNDILVPLDLKENIDSLLSINIKDKYYDFNVVGVNDKNMIIVNKNMYLELLENYDIYNYILLSHSYKDSMKDIEYLKSIDINAYLEDDSCVKEYKKLETYVNFIKYFIIILLILIMIFIFIILKNVYYSNIKDIALLKMLGLNDINNSFKFIFKFVFMLVLSYLISLSIFTLFTYFINIILDNNFINFIIKFIFIKKYLIILFLIILIIIIYNFIIIKKIHKINIIQTLNEE